MTSATVRGASLALLLLSIFGCGRGDDDRPQVAFVTNGSARFWEVAHAGVIEGAREFDVIADFRTPTSNEDQKRVIEDLVTRGVDGIAVSPVDPVNSTSDLNEAAARTHVITHDSDAPDSKRRCYVGMDNYDAGRLCGRVIEEALPDGGSVMIFIGRLEQDNGRRRRQGVIDELLDRSHDPSRFDPPGEELVGDKYTILGTLTDQFDHARGKANAEDTLSRHPDVDCMVGLFEYNTPLCLEAVRQAGKLDDVTLVAFDEADATLQGIKDGTIYATVVQDPYGYGRESVRILAGLARGDESVLPADGFLDLPARRIGPDEVDEFWADLNRKLAAAAGE